MRDDAEPNADKWATADETRDGIVALYRRVTAGSDAVIEALPLDAVGEVPWWPPEMRTVTLGRILAHTTTETYRHAGHADIVRELIDGAAGLARDGGMLPDGDRTWWERHRARLEQAARK